MSDSTHGHEPKVRDEASNKGFFTQASRELPRVKSNVRAGTNVSPINYVAKA